MQDSEGVAVVGCGRWGANLARNFSELGRLVRICDRDPAALNRLAGVQSQAEAGTSFEDVLEDERVLGVVIATPAASHARLALEVISAGKDVFVEKPLALRYREGFEVVAAAEAANRILMVGHLLEYHPAIASLRQLVRRGELGDVRYLYSSRLNLGTVRTEENILWSFAPHDISAITSLVGFEPVEVSATGGAYLQDGIADVTMTNLVFAHGVRAHVFVSWLHPYKEQRLVVVGEKKMAVFDQRDGDSELLLFDKGIEWKQDKPVPREDAVTSIEFDRREPLHLECAAFLEAIDSRQAPLTDGANGLRVLKILEACQTSIERRGAPVELSEVESGVPA